MQKDRASHLDKDNLATDLGYQMAESWVGGSWRKVRRVSVLQPVGWIQPALAAAKAGHYQVGVYWIALDKLSWPRNIFLRAPEFLLVVSQNSSRRATI